jgi:aspartate carbamoyltransferase catalytic subunit
MDVRPLHHVIGIGDLTREQIIELHELADSIRTIPARARRHQGRIVATLFYEPSTRTRLSFESAALRIGAQVIGFADPKASSAAKGETLIDTIRTVERYCDAIVLRHPAEGAAMLASKVAHVPIINAGDGGHEHPTQTLFDLYTIRQRFGNLDGRIIGFTGDLRYGRTVHSLAKAAAMFGAKLIFIAPEPLQMPAHELEQLRKQTSVETADELAHTIARLDVLYATRLQAERLDETTRAQIKAIPPLRVGDLGGAKDGLMILHPLPRVDEIEPHVDCDARAWYFEQVANGVLMRMAILDQILTSLPESRIGAADRPIKPSDPPWHEQSGLSGRSCTNAKCVTHTERRVMLRSADGESCDYCDHPLQ